MADAKLMSFVEESLRAGASRDNTERVLIEAGWSRDQVSGALNSYSDIDFPVPVPKPSAQISARDAFMYLVMFAMLYISAFNFGRLLFEFINIALPESADALVMQRSGGVIRWATSSLLVAFPVFLFVATRISKSLERDPTQRVSGVRKWLTYLTLAITAVIIVGDLIYLLNSLLSGELTSRILLKALTVGGIAGSIFGYYMWWMRSDDKVLTP